MRRKTWVLAAAAIVIALAATGAVVITAGPKQQALAAQPSPVTTAQVQKRTLSATGTLTFGPFGVRTHRPPCDGPTSRASGAAPSPAR